MALLTTRSYCRVCAGPITDLFSIGPMALAAFPATREAVRTINDAPLDLCACADCDLVQLRHTVDPDRLFRQYWYRSAINETMRAELQDVVKAALLEVSVFPGDDVIDVGANDGYLLSCYPKMKADWRIQRIAYEPATNLQADCAKAAEQVIPDYFPTGVEAWERRVKILTSIAAGIYATEDPVAFVRAIDTCLHPDGVWVVQFQDLAQMVDQTAFDNICHEHLTYWSLATFETLLQQAGVALQVVHAERRLINGGSLRLLVRRPTFPVRATVDALRLYERPSVSWSAIERFAWKAGEVRYQIQAAVEQATGHGLTIDLYGASTKANTLLQYCGLDGTLIRQAWERNREKVGRWTATGIPIVDEVSGRASKPDILLATIWQFRSMILQREAQYLQQGGRILFPLPEVDLVTGRQVAAEPV